MQISFDNSYATLPDRFYTRQAPVPVAAPHLVALNRPLAAELGLDADALAGPHGVAVLAGNAVPPGADPLAQVYAGHQFGGWVPQLGDGRAILLGEVIDRHGHRRDIQLKGAGRTPYSRMGDGRAWLGPVLREYLVSEAMAAMGIPTTRALAAVTTGEDILRETGPMPGAILTRVAASHIRVGTFQYFAARQDTEALAALADHAIARHYPDAAGPLDLLDRVVSAQARLIAQWMGVGFIHGVMNTDNMSVTGETIDYGPCAFMDAYHPETVFSSIDQFGRYAWGNQPDIAVWNLAQLATALLAVIDPDRDAAVEAATPVVNAFADRFNAAWTDVLRAKLGLGREEPQDLQLASDLLIAMAGNQADFTLTFRALSSDRPEAARELFVDPTAFDAWAARWRDRLAREDRPEAAIRAAMRCVNPAVIPRNHRIEQAIAAGVRGDFAPFEALQAALATPFNDPADPALAAPPQTHEVVQATFCGT